MQANRKIYEFDTFRLDVPERQLLKGERPVAITPKAFDLLVALVENNGSLIERDALYARVWPDRVVEDANLNVQISTIRKALEEPSCISTIPGHGYRFNWSVKVISGWKARSDVETSGILALGVTSHEVAAKVYANTNGNEGSPPQAPNVPVKSSRSNGPPLIAGIVDLFRAQRFVVGTLAVTLITVSVAAFFLNAGRPSPPLTEKDVILIADFVNTTGDEVFDGALKRGLSTHLKQSPFLSLFPDTSVRDALKMMNRSPDERITREIAREICERRGIKALIAGTIDRLGDTYVLTLEAINAQTAEAIAIQQTKAEGREQVLAALSQAADDMRESLGESLPSIGQFNAPINTTTSSLEALKIASFAIKEFEVGNEGEAISLFKRAVDIDPNFASAYTGMALAHFNRGEDKLGIEAAVRAFDLRRNMNEWEQFLVDDVYYSNVTQEIDKAIEQMQIMKKLYPRDSVPPTVLGFRYISVGEYEKAVEESLTALRINPNLAHPHRNLVSALIALNRFEEAKVAAEHAIELNLYAASFRGSLFHIALVQGDQKSAQEQLELMKGRSDGLRSMAWEIGARMYRGQWKAGRAYQEFANDLYEKSGLPGAHPAPTLIASSFGRCDYVRQVAPRVLEAKPPTHEVVLSSTALAFCGDSRVRPFIDGLNQNFPKTSIVHQRDLPMIRAALELGLGNADAAIELLWPVRSSHESTSRFWIQYTRGQAYLKLKRANEATIEFQKILDHRGEAGGSPLFPLAHLGLARALRQKGEIDKSRERYGQFFTIWKDADEDLPLVVEARREYREIRE